MKAVLDEILPSILPENVTFQTIKHEGKTDLEKSIPRKLRAFRIPNVQFVVMRDQDSGDCVKVKERLLQLCFEGGRTDTLIRIICHELESWFLGDLAAVEEAFKVKGLATKQDKSKFRDPDRLGNPSDILKRIVQGYEKLSGAREIAKHLNSRNNRSASFNNFLSGIQKIV